MPTEQLSFSEMRIETKEAEAFVTEWQGLQEKGQGQASHRL